MKKNKLLIVVLCLSMLLMSCGTAENKNASENNSDAGSKELKKVNFVLDWTPNTNHTGIYVAKELGYFEDEGIDLTIVQPAEDSAESAVATNYAQFGVSFQDYMVGALSGDTKMPVTAIAAILQHNRSGIMSRRGEGMDSPKGLEGKKYATWDLPIEKGIIAKVMKNDGGDFSKVELIPSTVLDEVTGLRSNEIDAVWVYYGWGGISAEVQNYPVDYFEFRDIDDTFDYYSPVIITNDTTIEKDPELVRGFLKAAKKGYEYAIENPEKAADILLKADPALEKDLVYRSQEWMVNEYKADSDQWGYIDPARWEKFFNWVNENIELENKLDPKAGFTNEFLQ